MCVRLPALTLLLVSVSSPAVAQLPGGPIVGPDRASHEFNQRMQIELVGYMREWERSWDADARKPLGDHYTQDALIGQPDGRFVRGIGEIRTFTDAMSAQTEEAFTSMTDFEASEGIAYTYGPYALVPANGDGTPGAGQLISVLFRDNDRWSIRTQVFLHSDPGPVLAAPGGSVHLPPFSLPSRSDADTRTRYAHAMTLLGSFRAAWNERNVERATSLLSDNALILFPGAETPVRGGDAVNAFETFLETSGPLTTAILDFDARARIAYLLGRYHVNAQGRARTGTFVIVLAERGGEPRVRALLFS